MKNKLSAAIDIGTNSCRLLIIKDSQPLVQRVEVTRIGQDLQTDGLIKDEPLERTIKVLKTYLDLLKEHDLDGTRLAATSAVRDALNKDYVVEKILAETGLELEILSGQEEARLTWLGAVSDFDSSSVVLDIGGGSTEIIFQDNYISIDLGGVRLKENSQLAESEKIREIFLAQIGPHLAPDGDFSKESLILAGGTGTSLAAIDLKLAQYDWTKVHGHQMSLERLQAIQERLLSLDLDQRRKVVGLEPERADIIVFGTLILLEFMEYFTFSQLTISEKDLLYALAEGR